MNTTLRALTLLALTTLAAEPLHAQWSTESLTIPRGELAAVTVGHYSLFAGGRKSDGPSKRVDIYDASTDTWSWATLSVKRRFIGATVVGDLALFAGGGYFGQAPTDNVDVFDARTGQWSLVHLSLARGSIAATTVGDKAIFAGGILDSPTSTAVVDIYDSSVGEPDNPSAWTQHSLSLPRANIAATTVGDLAMFAGGSGPSLAGTDRVDIYNNLTGEWTVDQLSVARTMGDQAAVTVGSLAIFPGGLTETPNVMTNIVDIYNEQTDSWSTASLSQSRAFLTGVVLGNTAIFAGGVQAKWVMSDVVDSFNAGTDKWETLSPLQEARGILAGTTIDGMAIFAGGLLSPTVATHVVDIYEPVGLNYCNAQINSSGQAATISSDGSASITSNDLLLRSTCMPATPFLFMQAPNQAQIPFGDGFLCVTGGIIRIQPAGVATGGVAQRTVDLANVGITTPGTHHFQCWFRDSAAGAAGFNTSDALEIEFTL